MDERDRKEGDPPLEETAEEPPDREGEEDLSQKELESLRTELKVKELEAKQNYDRFLRQAAELDNFRKRMARQKDETVKYGNESLIRDLLPMLDNLERAVAHARGGGNGEPLLEGIEMVLKGLLEILKKHGVTQISALGEPFNPEKHEAVSQVESDEHEPNTVAEELQKGYYLLDRLLRPSLVSVAKPSEKKDEKSPGGEVEKGETDD